MQQRTRRPGDQAPPNPVIHRNEHIRTATTHVKDTVGKLYLVHDGDGGIITQADGTPAVGLSYDAARKAKDYAVTKLKCRRAGIEEHGEDAPEIAVAQSLPIELDPPNIDPQLEENRQKALAAARAKAQEAQKRADEMKRRQNMRAPGWEAPPQGVSGAGKVSAAPQSAQRAPGWVDPSKQKAPIENVEIVGLDDVADADGVELEGDAADLLVNTDLETDVKEQTELAHAEAKKLWDGMTPADQQAFVAKLKSVSDPHARAVMFEGMTNEEADAFEATEIAYKLLFPNQAAHA